MTECPVQVCYGLPQSSVHPSVAGAWLRAEEEVLETYLACLLAAAVCYFWVVPGCCQALCVLMQTDFKGMGQDVAAPQQSKLHVPGALAVPICRGLF